MKINQEMIDALTAFDMDKCRKLYPFEISNEGLEQGMHKTRYICSDVPAELRHASGHWLRERGLGSRTDTPLLPEGELP